MKANILFLAMLVLLGAPASAGKQDIAAPQDDEEAAEAQQQKKALKQKEQKQEEQRQYLYQWTDGKGVVHITDDLAKVPKQYRQNARKLESRTDEEEKAGAPSPPARTVPSTYDDAQEREAEQKDEWQQRMRAARRTLANAERRYRELEQRRDAAIMSWGGPASGRLQGREEAARIEAEMKQAQQQIEAARREIEVTIPDDARKAGIPPGWLRE
jgi:hypothetical protein